ncbi:MAG: hypothetical protein CMH63_02380 [Nanoarchaeota archaeon]|jgi:small-conductance mechanosensitive channel|nr:hypothetical protein [Nanoarchaeota archaeon]|tara:strand:- start:2613 stop:3191 length:579 start_codon:yes stop_codon:yes gene_type:complete
MVDTNQVLDMIVRGNLSKLIVAIVVILIGFLIGRFLGNLTKKVLKELNTNKILKENLGINLPIEQFLSGLVYYLILFVAVVMALNQLGLSTIILYIILVIVLVIVVGLVVLAFKDFIPNVFASFWIHQKNILKEGDKIEIKDVKGVVEEITLTEVKIKTKDNEVVLIPNSLLFKEKIKKSLSLGKKDSAKKD